MQIIAVSLASSQKSSDRDGSDEKERKSGRFEKEGEDGRMNNIGEGSSRKIRSIDSFGSPVHRLNRSDHTPIYARKINSGLKVSAWTPRG